ncbi:MAG: sulfite dehydrogenase [Gammaproteobacteria bacterium]
MDNRGTKPLTLYPDVAGNGLLDRRLFITTSLKFGMIATLGAVSEQVLSDPIKKTNDPIDPADPPWMHHAGGPFSTYGKPSKYENSVIRAPSPNRDVPGNGVSWTPLHLLEGSITPNGLHFERHHNGVPQIPPQHHQLLIHGLVKQPSIFTINDLLRYPMRSQILFLECGGNSNAGWHKQPSRAEAGYFHGLASCSEWTGIPLATILDETGLRKEAKWLIAEGADAFAMNISIPMKKAMDDGILALYQNGERLRPENGYPLRLILPGWEGVLNVKWLHRLKATDRPIMARNETALYTELQPSGKARMFTFVIEAKSLITAPSSGMVLKSGPGLYPITGLAWSGRGKVRRVDVSTDGGKTWAQALLEQPVLPKAFTRFRIPWRWDGRPSILKSRVTDETGYVQPERDELVARRGRQGFFHYNAIVTWAVDEDGLVTHIYDQHHKLDSGAIDIGTGWD